MNWGQDFGAQVHNVWVSVGWVTRISRDESTWRDHYDKAEHRDPMTLPCLALPDTSSEVSPGR